MTLDRLRDAVSFALFLYAVAVLVLKVPFYIGLFFGTPQLLAGSLIFVGVLQYLSSGKGGKGRSWIDLVPLLLILPGAAFMLIFYESALDYEAYGFLDTKGTVLAFLLAAGLVLLIYRRTGWAMPALIVSMLLMVRFQSHLPGLLHGKGYEFSRMGFGFYLGGHGVFGLPFKIASTILICFIVFGRLFQSCGGGRWILEIASWILGSSKGGIAKVSVLGSAFFGTISGSPSANTASTGSITIPMMIQSGYPPAMAGAIEAVASTGGQFTPPVMGAIVFIMAEWLEISYASIIAMAALPALLFYVILFSTVHFEALRSRRPVMARSDVKPIANLLKEGWVYLATFGVLIFLLLVLQYDPEKAVLFSMPVLIVGSFLGRRRDDWLTPAKIYRSVADSVSTWLTVAAVTSAVGMIIGAITLSGLGIKISGFLIEASNGELLALLVMVGLASFFLGMGLDSIPCYMTVAILTAPALMQIGISDVAAHLFVIYWGMASFFTPPVCIAVYVACGISGAPVWQTGLNAVKFGIGVFLVPFAFVLHPELLLQGSIPRIALTGALALVGAAVLGAGLAGYGAKSLTPLERGLMIAGAVVLIVPGTLTFALGASLIAASLAWQWFTRTRPVHAAET